MREHREDLDHIHAVSALVRLAQGAPRSPPRSRGALKTRKSPEGLEGEPGFEAIMLALSLGSVGDAGRGILQLDAHGVGNLVWALGRLGHHPGFATLDFAAGRAQALAAFFSPADLSQFLWGCTKLKYSLTEPLAKALAGQIAARAGDMSGVEVASILSSWSKLGGTSATAATVAAASVGDTQRSRETADSSGGGTADGGASGGAGDDGGDEVVRAEVDPRAASRTPRR